MDTPKDCRFECRDSDNNISPWAGELRLAGEVGMVAIMQTPLVHELPMERLKEYRLPSPQNPANILHLQPDGAITLTSSLIASADFEQKLAELLLEDYVKHGEELPELYRELFEQQYQYCDDFKDVLRGNKKITDLADRSDWAAKFRLILRGIERDVINGKTRSLHDYASQGSDQLYDSITITANAMAEEAEPKVTVAYGAGFKMRERGAFVVRLDPAAVARARTTPPDTRARDRVALMKSTANVTKVSWRGVTTDHGVTNLPLLLGGNKLI
jgi:hypothetical protein